MKTEQKTIGKALEEINERSTQSIDNLNAVEAKLMENSTLFLGELIKVMQIRSLLMVVDSLTSELKTELENKTN